MPKIKLIDVDNLQPIQNELNEKYILKLKKIKPINLLR